MDHIENYWPVFISERKHWMGRPWEITILKFFKRRGAIGMIDTMHAAGGWKGTFADLNLPYKDRKIVRTSREESIKWFERELPILLRSRDAREKLEQQINEEIQQREAEYMAEVEKMPKRTPMDFRPQREIEEDEFNKHLASIGLPQTKAENFKRMKELLKM